MTEALLGKFAGFKFPRISTQLFRRFGLGSKILAHDVLAFTFDATNPY